MWLARFTPFPDGELCNQSSHSIWTFSTFCPNKDYIFSFRSSFNPIWETSSLSFCFFSGAPLCFTSHFSSFCSRGSLYVNCGLLWFMRPLFVPSHLNKAKYLIISFFGKWFSSDIYVNPSDLLKAVSIQGSAHEEHLWQSWLCNTHEILKGQIEIQNWKGLPQSSRFAKCIRDIHLACTGPTVGGFRISLVVF